MDSPKIIFRYDTNKEEMSNSNSVIVNQPIPLQHNELTLLVFILVIMVAIMLLTKTFVLIKRTMRSSIEAQVHTENVAIIVRMLACRMRDLA